MRPGLLCNMDHFGAGGEASLLRDMVRQVFSPKVRNAGPFAHSTRLRLAQGDT